MGSTLDGHNEGHCSLSTEQREERMKNIYVLIFIKILSQT